MAMLRARTFQILLFLFVVATAVLVWWTKAPRQRLVVIGVDGATWKVLGPLLAAGELPNFARLMREGAYMPEFDTMETTRSPAVWTSVATGRLPKDHGIAWYTQKLATGQEVPVTSDLRKVKAIWNVASEAGLSVGIVGWWASWPAEQVSGYIVTDQANPAAVGWLWPQLTGKDPSVEQQKRTFSPPDLAPVLAEYWFDTDHYPYAELKRRSGLNDEQMTLVEQADWSANDPYSWLKISFAVDYPNALLASRLARERPTDLQMIYLRGPDPLQHKAWDLVEPQHYENPPQHLERDRGIVEGVYRYVDSFIGEIIAANPAGTAYIIASDHGSEPCPGLAVAIRPGCHSEAAKGILFIHGERAKRNHVIRDGDPLDLMPTMAWLLGLPIADDLAGAVLFDAFEDDATTRAEVSRVASYGQRGSPQKSGGPSAADPVLMERLRSLGYLNDEK